MRTMAMARKSDCSMAVDWIKINVDLLVVIFDNRRMRILAIDPSKTNTGWAVIDSARWSRVASGAESFQHHDDYAELGGAFESWLVSMCRRWRVDVIAVERPPMRGTSTYLLFGLCWTVHRVGHHLGLRRMETGPSEIKKWATGKGDAGKPEMVAAARKAFPGHEPADHDEADALLIGAWSASVIRSELAAA